MRQVSPRHGEILFGMYVTLWIGSSKYPSNQVLQVSGNTNFTYSSTVVTIEEHYKIANKIGQLMRDVAPYSGAYVVRRCVPVERTTDLTPLERG